jgi:hypothetical protein
MSIRIMASSGENGSQPLSIAEKKTAERARQELAIKEAVDKHPLVRTALDVFGGEVVAYKQ